MSTNFNPARAVKVDETAEDGELADFLDAIDSKAKKFRSQIIGDAFRELANSAKQERGKLLDAAAQKFAALMAKELTAFADSVKATTEAAKAVATSCDCLMEDQKETKATLTKLPKKDQIEQSMREMMAEKGDDSGSSDRTGDAVSSAMNGIRLEIAAMEARHNEAQVSMKTEIVAAMKKATAVAPPTPKTSWRLVVSRDTYNRISEVTATPV